MTHIENLKLKIEKLKSELLALGDQVVSIRDRIGKEMREITPNESKVDKLQVEREAIARREERIKIRLRATEEQRPYALKKDGEVLLYAKADELKVFASQAAERVPLLAKALNEVIRLAGDAYKPYIDSLTTSYDIELLCKKYSTQRPAKANVGQPSPGKVQALIDCLEGLNKDLKNAQQDAYRLYSDKLHGFRK